MDAIPTGFAAFVVAISGLAAFAAGLMLGLAYARRVACNLCRARMAVGRLLKDPALYAELRSYAGFDR